MDLWLECLFNVNLMKAVYPFKLCKNELIPGDCVSDKFSCEIMYVILKQES